MIPPFERFIPFRISFNGRSLKYITDNFIQHDYHDRALLPDSITEKKCKIVEKTSLILL